MSRNKSVKQRLDGEQHYDELESDFLKKIGINVTGGIEQ